jgi:hypothetical protein
LNFEELNRRQSRPAKGLRLADSYRCCRLRFSARPDWHRQRIDCGFRNLSSTWACYLVFKDRVACTTRDFLLPLLLLLPAVSNRRGRIVYSSPHPLSTSTFASSWPLEVFSAAQWLPLFLSRGRGFYRLAAVPVNCCFVDFPNRTARSTSSRAFLRRGSGFYHRRIFCQLASSTAVFRLSVLLTRLRSAFRASARASVRGARLLPPPRFESTATC